jgi:hypothetical protein
MRVWEAWIAEGRSSPMPAMGSSHLRMNYMSGEMKERG